MLQTAAERSRKNRIKLSGQNMPYYNLAVNRTEALQTSNAVQTQGEDWWNSSTQMRVFRQIAFSDES